MAKKKVQQPRVITKPDFAVGTPIVVTLPHLWSGCAGVVVSVTDHVHRVKIAGKNGATFHSDAYADELEVDL